MVNRRKVLVLAGIAGIGGFSGCLREDRDEIADAGNEETDEENNSDDMAGEFDFSSCDHDLNGERISYKPLDETRYNSPSEDDMISAGVGYYEGIEDDKLRELKGIFGGDAAHSEGSQSFTTGRAGIHKCDVARLSNKDYIEYIVPLPVDEE